MVRSPEYQTGSLQHASATYEAKSDDSVDLQGTTLSSSGSVTRTHSKLKSISTEDRTCTAELRSHAHFIKAAMERFHQDNNSLDLARRICSGRSQLRHTAATVASAGVTSGSHAKTAVSVPHIQVSAISELKEFSGKEKGGRLQGVVWAN
ncbi:LOW QUALITY PROTEIN: Branched-chain alpha-keto acid dehydrogenase subunit E2 [Phytophthora palmivora]|uniref:Branched-chain alpha-keto acid dehydrogenase subunit E2 n=1 Tax=Phytophthora palmivora TaxID=4796 RepID=A0A2P4XKB0_9STRA|nr:LOW QUALITY PROTEIN: Branched-chain alpha-keto acid dehydrogenase subunit E2 [Phytophthora palmivora]